MRIYADYNQDFFSEKSLEACYYAGLIAADGSVSDSGTISLCLKIEDKAHLEQFREKINGNPVREIEQFLPSTGKYYGRADFCMGSVKMTKDLDEIFNIKPRKSLTHEPPVGLSKEQNLAFIAGYIDGDGSYTYSLGKKENRPILNILGTKSFLTWILHEFGLNGNEVKIHQRGAIHEVHIRGDKAIRSRDLYINMDLPFLKRKYKRWETLGLNMDILDGTKPNLKKTTHGTTRMYSYYKCRCDLCKKATSEYMKKRYQSMKGTL